MRFGPGFRVHVRGQEKETIYYLRVIISRRDLNLTCNSRDGGVLGATSRILFVKARRSLQVGIVAKEARECWA
jgi:hypothetical protein